MASFKVLLAALLLVGFSANSFGININTYCIDHHLHTGNHRHPYDCSKFIECNSGITNVMDCPYPLAYIYKTDQCGDEADVPGCNIGGTWTPRPATTRPVNDILRFCALRSLPNGTYSHPYDCHKYIKCTNLNTEIMNCTGSLIFDPNDKSCDVVQRVPYCSSGIRPSSWIYKDDTLYCKKLSLRNGIDYPNPTMCNSYFNCNGDVTRVKICPTGLHYSLNSRSCLKGLKVNCQDNFKYFKVFIG